MAPSSSRNDVSMAPLQGRNFYFMNGSKSVVCVCVCVPTCMYVCEFVEAYMFAYVLNSNKSAIEKRKKFLVIDVFVVVFVFCF